MKEEQEVRSRVEAFKNRILPAESVLVVAHDYPDPDCLASAAGLCHLLTYWGVKNCAITHGGFVGRAENKAMISLLEINTTPFVLVDLNGYDRIIIVDALPCGGNLSLPAEVEVDAVFDHHSEPDNLPASTFAEIMPDIGATSTLIAMYLFEAGCPISMKLATGLYYGIKTDTHDMALDVRIEDLDAFQRLFKLLDHRLLARIEHPQRNMGFFVTLDKASRSFEICQDLGWIFLGRVDTPDHVAEMADLYHSFEDLECTVCAAVFEQGLFFSVRTKKNAVAGKLAKKLAEKFRGSGGGHGKTGAGRIPLGKGEYVEEVQKIKDKLKKMLSCESNWARPFSG